jgi:hypothetical protein
MLSTDVLHKCQPENSGPDARPLEHFLDKDVGDVDAWQGTLDKTTFHLFGMKEPDHVM